MIKDLLFSIEQIEEDRYIFTSLEMNRKKVNCYKGQIQTYNGTHTEE